jgi:hypothetical protein
MIDMKRVDMEMIVGMYELSQIEQTTKGKYPHQAYNSIIASNNKYLMLLSDELKAFIHGKVQDHLVKMDGLIKENVRKQITGCIDCGEPFDVCTC